jgi:hypothetical protein
MSFVPPSQVETVVVLPPEADPQVVLSEAARTLKQRFDLVPDTWDLNDGVLHKGFPAPEELAVLSLEERGFSADGRETGIIMLTRFTPKPYDFPYWETYGFKDCWGFRVISPDLSKEEDSERVGRSLAAPVAIVRALIGRCPVLRANVTRAAPVFAPAPPHAMPSDVLFIAERAEIARDYTDPDVYWRSWDSATELEGDRVLVTRALDVVCEVEYKRRTYPAAWAMARAARPGLTTYGHSAVDDLGPGERALLNAEQATLWHGGYHPEEQWLDFTAMVPEGAHIAAREILMLHDLVTAKQIPSGKPLRSVRVTFPDRAMAEGEARPLLDNGVVVQFFSDIGTWEVLEG